MQCLLGAPVSRFVTLWHYLEGRQVVNPDAKVSALWVGHPRGRKVMPVEVVQVCGGVGSWAKEERKGNWRLWEGGIR